MRAKLSARSRGSALLYSILLVGALVVIAQISFNLAVFSIFSRRQSYQNEVTYWLAWGGVEAALYKIKKYAPRSDSFLWLNWPRATLVDSNEEKLKQIDLSVPRSYYRLDLRSLKKHFLNSVSVAYFTQSFPYKFELDKDESAVFDVSRFSGWLKVRFLVKGNNKEELEKNLVWFRVEDPQTGRLYEGIVRFRPLVGTGSLSGKLTTGGGLFSLNQQAQTYLRGGTPLKAQLGSCSYLGGGQYSCSFRISNFAGQFRLLKIKVFGGSAQLTFESSGGAGDNKLGLPESLIHSQGCFQESCRDLYVRFPNRLKSVFDVLDYSIYQANFD